ncbi:protein transparent testa 12, partial [Phtheirospermum japonicum]
RYRSLRFNLQERVDQALVLSGARHLDLHFPVLAQHHHPNLFRPCGNSGPRRLLHPELNPWRFIPRHHVWEWAAHRNPLRAGVRCWADGNAGRVNVEILGYSSLNIYIFINVYVHIRGASVAAARAVGRYFSTLLEFRDVDDPSAVRLRDQLSNRQVLASSEQDDGHGLDFRCHGQSIVLI